MKRTLLIIALAVGAIIGLSIPAFATGNTCNATECIISYGTNHGWNDWNGNTNGGAPVKYYQSTSAENSEFNYDSEGQVCNGESGYPCFGAASPFIVGSGLNARYDGRPIYAFPLSGSSGLCADQGNFSVATDSGYLELQTCNETQYVQEFVYSSSDYLAPVNANNQEYQSAGTGNLPVLVSGSNGSPCSEANGTLVTMDGANTCVLQFDIQQST